MSRPRPRFLTSILALNAVISIILFVTPIWAQTQTDVVGPAEQRATLLTPAIAALLFALLTFLAWRGISTFMWAIRIGASVLCLVYGLIFLFTEPAGVNLLALAFASPLLGWLLFFNWFFHRAPVRAFYQAPAGQGQAHL